MAQNSKKKSETQKIGYRYWHYTSGEFFDAVLQMQKDFKGISKQWFDFAKRFGGVPAHQKCWGRDRCSGVIFKEPIDGWREISCSKDGGTVYIPHGVKSKALLKEFKALPVMVDISEKWGFHEALKNGRAIVTPSIGVYGKPPIVYVSVYQDEESEHSPPEGGKELLTWEWEKWLHDIEAKAT